MMLLRRASAARRPTRGDRKLLSLACHGEGRWSHRRLEMTVLMTPDMANFSGKVHGGALLNLLE